MANAIVTDRLTKYFGGRRVVNGLNLQVREGSVYALLGRNGAGKSTTIRMLLGLLKPDFGTAELLGEEVSQITPATRAQIAWVGEGHPLYRWMTVDGAIRFVRPFYQQWNGDFVDQVLDHFDIPKKKRLSKLSNGQRAQVSLALAVAPDPKLLILDDPTIGLDAVVRRDFLESIIQIIQQQGRTILFSSHILSDVDRVADHIGILSEGVLRVDCPTEHFRESLRKVVVELAEPLKAAAVVPRFDVVTRKRRAVGVGDRELRRRTPRIRRFVVAAEHGCVGVQPGRRIRGIHPRPQGNHARFSPGGSACLSR